MADAPTYFSTISTDAVNAWSASEMYTLAERQLVEIAKGIASKNGTTTPAEATAMENLYSDVLAEYRGRPEAAAQLLAFDRETNPGGVRWRREKAALQPRSRI